jgi:PBSX family phage terminase large subunit
MSSFQFSPKQLAYLASNDAKVEFLEGTTASGKTTVGAYKFMLRVMASEKQMHVLAAEDTGTAEKNIIQKDNGVLDLLRESIVEYRGNGNAQYKMPHMVLHTNRGDKIVFIIGYRDKARWKDALGGQYGCLYIDEINTANMDFVREAMMRADYVIGTLNPDDPALPIYKEYINRSRPNAICLKDEPREILAELREPAQKGWDHWFFSFEDSNISEAKKQTIIENVPVGTKLYKNKILGIRCKATGLVFGNFGPDNIVPAKEISGKVKEGEIRFRRLSLGVDTAYSSQSPDTIAMELNGVTTDGDLYTLEERTFNNKDRNEPLAPSDVVREIVAFADFCRIAWGDFRNIFIDSADQATITECLKYKRENGCIYLFTPAYKAMKVIDRINLQLGWIAERQYLVADTCTEHIRELGVYSWQEDKDIPEDGNDHTINACQYAWLPWVQDIG